MKRLIFIVVLIIFIFVINNLVHSIYSLWQKQELLVNAQKTLEKEKKDNVQLKKTLVKEKHPYFVEEQARDKLLLVKPGENMVVLDPKLIASPSSAQTTPHPAKPNWRLWWELFFN